VELLTKSDFKMKKNNEVKMGLTLGIIGFIAGIFLIFFGNNLIGIFGSIASAGIAIKSYKGLKNKSK
jgi:uncharacterized membrane protein YkgB